MKSKEPRGQELIDRYKSNYQLSDEVIITEEMILHHWNLEKKLRTQLLNSTDENRWEIFEQCYTRLYSDIEWLNKYTGSDIKEPIEKMYSHWPLIIGETPKYIFEIGSGKGVLINYLSNYGYICKGTEITHERGEKNVNTNSNLSWGISDGIHLNRFESEKSYDVVISTNVIEHLHPNDILEHFKNVNLILRNKGRYIFETPNKLHGPSDVSKVFSCDTPLGMHLKEYYFQEIKELLMRSGFRRILAVWIIPYRFMKPIGINIPPKSSRWYFKYLCMIEKLILLFPNSYRQEIAYFSKYLSFRSALIIAQKL
jgi:SAM-dependent methyltransferase